MTLASADTLKQRALELGFNLVGLTRAEPSPTLDAYLRWLERGMHGRMGYLARPDRVERRQNLQAILPGAQSLILVGLDYRTGVIPEAILHDPSRGRIAAYAWGLDYHDTLTPRLEQLAQWLRDVTGVTMAHRVYVDTGALLERSHAQQAGMGFIGKNTMLIHPRRGSDFFIGEIITTLEFDAYDAPHRPTMCGTCTRCLHACPTDAFPQPHVLDARRCISYHTIENKGVIDRALRAAFGNWIFGCDVCQEVCPFQRFAAPTAERDFYPPDVDRAAPLLSEVLMLDDDAFRARFAGSPLVRIKRERLVRNACIAAGNSHDETLIPHLIQLLYDPSALIRAHAAWGLYQLMGTAASRLLTDLYDRERDNDHDHDHDKEVTVVREEIASLLA